MISVPGFLALSSICFPGNMMFLAVSSAMMARSSRSSCRSAACIARVFGGDVVPVTCVYVYMCV